VTGERGPRDITGPAFYCAESRFVSHEHVLADVDTAMQMSMNPQSLKVVMNPSLT